MPWRRSLPPPPPPKTVSSSPLPSCITLCASASCSVTSMVPECHKEGTMGGGGFHTPVSPRCPRCAGARSAPAFPSALPPDHYILRLGRSLVLILQETLYFRSWDFRPCLPHHTPTPTPLSPLRAGFGSAPPVTP